MTVGKTRAGRIAVAAITATALAGVGVSAANASGNINLVGYAVPGPAFEKIIKAYQKTKVGKGTTFATSYGASGDQSRAVANGQPADFVNFSVEPDITRLVDAGLVDANWKTASPYKSVPAWTVVAFGVRPGNPKKIKDWADLIKPGVQIVTPDFKTSGSAKWNDLAAFGQAKKLGGSDQAGLDYLKAFYKNVVAFPKSGREATDTFAGGTGDVVITYESEGLEAQHEGVKEQVIVPKTTLIIEPPAAVIKSSSNLTTAKSFNSFLYTVQAQKLWGQAFYRPSNVKVLKQFQKIGKLGNPKTYLNVNYFGGWDNIDGNFFKGNGWAVQARNAAN